MSLLHSQLKTLVNQRCCRLLSTTANYCSAEGRKTLTERKKSERVYHDTSGQETSDLPLRFSTSEAVKGLGSDQLGLGVRIRSVPPPKQQAPAIIFSMIAILVYFCILREENDIDLMIGSDPRTMYEKVPGIEKIHLETAIKNYKLEGRNTDDLEKRLAELNAQQEQ